MLGEEELEELHAWNATTTVYPRDATVHALFEAEAARRPT